MSLVCRESVTCAPGRCYVVFMRKDLYTREDANRYVEIQQAASSSLRDLLLRLGFERLPTSARC